MTRIPRRTRLRPLAVAIAGTVAMAGLSLVGLGGNAATAQVVGPPASSTAPRIMVMGDSISAGVLGQPSYRKDLLDRLSDAACIVDMVGSQRVNGFDYRDPESVGTNYPGFGPDDYDVEHQAFPAIQTQDYAQGASNRAGTPVVSPVGVYSAAYQPDYVLLHLGTNDLAAEIRRGLTEGGIDDWAATTRTEMESVIERTIDSHPNSSELTILVANFIPFTRADYNSTQKAVASAASLAFTGQLEAMVRERTDSRAEVRIVDVASGYDLNRFMLSDGFHPNDAGERHIAGRFFDALIEAGACSPSVPAPDPTTAIHTGSQAAVHMELKDTRTGAIVCSAYNSAATTRPQAECPTGTWTEQLFDARWSQVAPNRTVTVGAGQSPTPAPTPSGQHTGSQAAVHMELKDTRTGAIVCSVYNTGASTAPVAVGCPTGTFIEQLFDAGWNQVAPNLLVTVS